VRAARKIRDEARLDSKVAYHRPVSEFFSSLLDPLFAACAADRNPGGRLGALRLWFASMAYVLLCALRRIGLPHTPFTDASCGTIRLKLKIGALVRISVRRIKIAMASGCPAAHIWGCAAVRLATAANARGSPA
jgi:hypothetical protein